MPTKASIKAREEKIKREAEKPTRKAKNKRGTSQIAQSSRSRKRAEKDTIKEPKIPPEVEKEQKSKARKSQKSQGGKKKEVEVEESKSSAARNSSKQNLKQMMKVKFKDDKKLSVHKTPAIKKEEAHSSTRKSNTRWQGRYVPSDQTVAEIEREEEEEKKAELEAQEELENTKFTRVKSDATKKRLSMSAKTSKSKQQGEDKSEAPESILAEIEETDKEHDRSLLSEQKENQKVHFAEQKPENSPEPTLPDQPENSEDQLGKPEQLDRPLETSQKESGNPEEEQPSGSQGFKGILSSQNSVKAIQGSVLPDNTWSQAEIGLGEFADNNSSKLTHKDLQTEEESKKELSQQIVKVPLEQVPSSHQEDDLQQKFSQPKDHTSDPASENLNSGYDAGSSKPSGLSVEEKPQEEIKEAPEVIVKPEVNPTPWITPEERKEDTRRSIMISTRLSEVAERVASTSPERASRLLQSKKKQADSKHRPVKNSNAKAVQEQLRKQESDLHQNPKTPVKSQESTISGGVSEESKESKSSFQLKSSAAKMVLQETLGADSKRKNFKDGYNTTMADVKPSLGEEEEGSEPVIGEKGNASPDAKDYDKFIN